MGPTFSGSSAVSTRLVLLGTGGGPMFSESRHGPSSAVVIGNRVYLVDCGNGVGTQLIRAGYSVDQLRATFITHHHSDHNADLGNLFLLAWARLSERVTVIGPEGLDDYFSHFLRMHGPDRKWRSQHSGRPPLESFIQRQEHTSGGVVYNDDLVRVTAALVEHPPVAPSFAYRFDSADRSIVFSGDTRPCRSLVDLANGADVLVHEVMRASSLDSILCGNNGRRVFAHLMESHTEVSQVGSIAAAASVGHLVLNHFVPSDGVSDEDWLAEARQGFDGPVTVGQDLLSM